LRTCRMSPASKSPQVHDAHRSDRCPPSIRPVHRSDWPSVVCRAHFGLRSWLCGSTKEPSGFLVNHCKPCILGVTSTLIPLMTSPPWLSRLGLGFEAQLRNHTRLRLALSCHHAAALDPVNHRRPHQACLSLYTWRPHKYRPFALVLHLHRRNQTATCTCNTGLRVSPRNVVNHSSLRSDHLSVLGRTHVLNGPQQTHY
jgi:hypothetical protein